jgi:uncharacterized membrane protein YidH (DUF202 family)
MKKSADSNHLDGRRLKELNLELGDLAREHRACRVNSFTFSALAAVLLGVSVLLLVQLISAGANNWTQNPNSPVYAIALEQSDNAPVKAVVVFFAIVAALGLVYRARAQCSKQRRLWNRETDLLTEMRRIRDRLYVADQPRPATEIRQHRPPRQPTPLDPDEARGEYVGLYNPPASQGCSD